MMRVPPTGPAPGPGTANLDGGCMVWALPPDETCAGVARARVRETMRGLGSSEELVRDSATMASELATNVFAHALGGRNPLRGPAAFVPELYLYRRGDRPELVVKVFDRVPWKGAMPRRPEAGAESGRGLEVVAALAAEHGGSWGVHRTRSRLDAAPGKVVFFTVPVPAVAWRAPRRAAHQATDDLAATLAARGMGPLHHCHGWGIAVLSVRAGITVWTRGETFSVTLPPRGTVTFPTWDLTEAAEAIVQCGEDLDAG
ncbi:ATP-binding protein [Actinomadura sp. 6N118]|uniref:ATP-binding protein n=1 Tax=Actinomadura sp. 6N118 TaxID=3375151 RepID=UPI0037ACEAA0